MLNNKSLFSGTALSLLTLLFLLNGCQNKDSQSLDQKTDTTAAVSSSTSKKILDQADYLNFAKELAATVNDRNPTLFNDRFNISNIVAELVAEIEAPENFQEGFTAGVENSLNVGDQVISSLGTEGSFKLLRLKDFPERPTAIFRLISKEGLNYYEVYLSPINQTDSIMIKDFYIYMGAQVFSSTLKRLYLSSLPDSSAAKMTKDTTDAERAFISYLPEIEEVGQLILEEKQTKAMKKIETLPTILREDKMIQIMRVNVAFNVDSLTYEKAVADFKALYPNDPVIELMALDFSFLKGNYKRSLEAIDNLNDKVGGDPYLKVMKADIYQDLKQYDTAEELLNVAIEDEPESEESYWSLILLLLDQDKYEQTVAIFDTMHRKFEVNPADFLIKKQYTKFWESDFYKKWEKEHPIVAENPDVDGTPTDTTDHSGHHHGHNH